MRAVLFSFPGWLCLFCASARSAPASSSTTPANRAHISTASHGSAKTEEMASASTALDFRELMRKERERAMKERMTAAAPSASASRTRHVSHRQTPLDLKRNHRVAPPPGDGQGIDGIYYVPGFVTKEEGRLLENAACSGGGGGGDGPEWKELHKRRLQIHGGTPHPSGMVEEELPPFLREVCDALVEAEVFPESCPPNHVLLNEYSSGQGIGPHKDGPLYEGRVAILSLGKEASLDFWGSLEDAKADCAAVASAAAASAPRGDAGAPDSSLTGSDPPSSSEGTPAEGVGATGTGECRGQQQKAAARRALASVRCEDCSLVVFEGAAYYDAWHGIASTATASDSSTTGGATATSQAAAGATANGGSGSKSDLAAPGGGGVLGSGDSRDRGDGAGGKRLSFTIRRVARVVPADSVMEHLEARNEMERRRRGFERSVTETGIVTAPKDS